MGHNYPLHGSAAHGKAAVRGSRGSTRVYVVGPNIVPRHIIRGGTLNSGILYQSPTQENVGRGKSQTIGGPNSSSARTSHTFPSIAQCVEVPKFSSGVIYVQDILTGSWGDRGVNRAKLYVCTVCYIGHFLLECLHYVGCSYV